ncbi:hypothetical protein IQ26_04721 [Mesorhizobium tianshanense]|uniref:Uncharacterized protein n=1 Tax=Mesorhizobium tianshanense TaxID=39844 RepID=A0A562NFM0_9HYPH|nr:hypothetical protein IQ26_04721 [Mesorhizobium tianshanense]
MRRLRFFNLATNRTQCMLAACAYNLRTMIGALYPMRGGQESVQNPEDRPPEPENASQGRRNRPQAFKKAHQPTKRNFAPRAKLSPKQVWLAIGREGLASEIRRYAHSHRPLHRKPAQ